MQSQPLPSPTHTSSRSPAVRAHREGGAAPAGLVVVALGTGAQQRSGRHERIGNAGDQGNDCRQRNARRRFARRHVRGGGRERERQREREEAAGKLGSRSVYDRKAAFSQKLADRTYVNRFPDNLPWILQGMCHNRPRRPAAEQQAFDFSHPQSSLFPELTLTSTPTLSTLSTMANPVVFFDVTIGGQPAGRIEMTVSRGRHKRTSDRVAPQVEMTRPDGSYAARC